MRVIGSDAGEVDPKDLLDFIKNASPFQSLHVVVSGELVGICHKVLFDALASVLEKHQNVNFHFIEDLLRYPLDLSMETSLRRASDGPDIMTAGLSFLEEIYAISTACSAQSLPQIFVNGLEFRISEVIGRHFPALLQLDHGIRWSLNFWTVAEMARQRSAAA